jgi:multicomponent Na+:H+ antiporter subunit E
MSSHALPDADGESAESAFPGLPLARETLRKLSPELRDLSLNCPLCGAPMALRGLRARPLRGRDVGQWQAIATCPACGLITAFDVESVQTEAIEAAENDDSRPWHDELRSFWTGSGVHSLGHLREAGWRHFAGAFVVTFFTWLLLTGSLSPADLLWGVLLSLLTARLTYRFAGITVPDWIVQPRRLTALGALIVEFVRQLVVQNVTLSLRVFHPRLPIRPGIVAIPTRMRGDVALTLLGSLTTLTPDTVTIDIDERRHMIYVHWIDVRSTDPAEVYRLISERLEQKIDAWLHHEGEDVPPLTADGAGEERTAL